MCALGADAWPAAKAYLYRTGQHYLILNAEIILTIHCTPHWFETPCVGSVWNAAFFWLVLFWKNNNLCHTIHLCRKIDWAIIHCEFCFGKLDFTTEKQQGKARNLHLCSRKTLPSCRVMAVSPSRHIAKAGFFRHIEHGGKYFSIFPDSRKKERKKENTFCHHRHHETKNAAVLTSVTKITFPFNIFVMPVVFVICSAQRPQKEPLEIQMAP